MQRPGGGSLLGGREKQRASRCGRSSHVRRAGDGGGKSARSSGPEVAAAWTSSRHSLHRTDEGTEAQGHPPGNQGRLDSKTSVLTLSPGKGPCRWRLPSPPERFPRWPQAWVTKALSSFPTPLGQQGPEATLTQPPSLAQQHQHLPRGPGEEQPGGEQ